MQAIAYAAILAVVAPVSIMTWLALTADRAGLRNIQSNLGHRPRSGGAAFDANDQLASLAKKAMPKGYAAWLDKQLAGAGRPKAWPLGRVVMVKPLLALAGAVLGVLLYIADPKPMKLGLALGVMALCYFVPDILLRNYAEKRRTAIKLELPDTLDQMLISVQAGLGFETAMARAGREPARDPWPTNSSGHSRTSRWVGPARRRMWPGPARRRPGSPLVRQGRRPGRHLRNRHRQGPQLPGAGHACKEAPAGRRARHEDAGQDAVSRSSSRSFPRCSSWCSDRPC